MVESTASTSLMQHFLCGRKQRRVEDVFVRGIIEEIIPLVLQAKHGIEGWVLRPLMHQVMYDEHAPAIRQDVVGLEFAAQVHGNHARVPIIRHEQNGVFAHVPLLDLGPPLQRQLQGRQRQDRKPERVINKRLTLVAIRGSLSQVARMLNENPIHWSVGWKPRSPVIHVLSATPIHVELDIPPIQSPQLEVTLVLLFSFFFLSLISFNLYTPLFLHKFV
mmetsp:Transcript_12899/g.24397  ORF Transcript_12899/g.24397 Transcript_12899/m.24397 type:complete len:219 (+) Transcript_12899:1038-1694(+)